MIFGYPIELPPNEPMWYSETRYEPVSDTETCTRKVDGIECGRDTPCLYHEPRIRLSVLKDALENGRREHLRARLERIIAEAEGDTRDA